MESNVLLQLDLQQFMFEAEKGNAFNVAVTNKKIFSLQLCIQKLNPNFHRFLKVLIDAFLLTEQNKILLFITRI